jgi:hypothetical protein
VIRMAVVAGCFQELLNFRGGWVLELDIVRARGGTDVFRLAYKLNPDEKHQQPQQDFFYHEARVFEYSPILQSWAVSSSARTGL